VHFKTLPTADFSKTLSKESGSACNQNRGIRHYAHNLFTAEPKNGFHNFMLLQFLKAWKKDVAPLDIAASTHRVFKALKIGFGAKMLRVVHFTT
jgi:hypothetical protein